MISLSRGYEAHPWPAIGAVLILLAGLAITLTIHLPLKHQIAKIALAQRHLPTGGASRSLANG